MNRSKAVDRGPGTAHRARRAGAALALTALLLSPAAGSASEDQETEVEIIEVSNLQEEAAAMRTGRIPMLLLVSQEHCPFCVQIKNDILGPMVRSGDYEDRALIREIFIDLGTDVRDFSGQERESLEFAHDYGVDLTPTLLFLDSRGRELSRRLIGLYTPEMFSFYVDRALDDAVEKLR